MNTIYKNLEYFESQTQGETIFKSNGSGKYALSPYDFFLEENTLPVETFEDPTITIKKLNTCVVTNRNVIISSNGNIVLDNGYHQLAPPIKIQDHGLKPDSIIVVPSIGWQCQVMTEDTTDIERGFYIGDTDNFGHWLFEFLPKFLWYKKIFPNNDYPILIGNSVPEKWLELIKPLGIDTSIIKRFASFKSLFCKELIICSASCKRTNTNAVSIRMDDFFKIRSLVENYYAHTSFDGDYIDCLFCTRKNARWRKTKNEDEVVEWLENNFKKVVIFEPEKLSIRDQLTLLGKTKFFFSTGGCLPFGMFSSKDSVLFELRPPEGHGFVGRIWSDIFRFGYHRISADWCDGVQSEVDMKDFHLKDLSINFEQFKKDVLSIKSKCNLF